MQEKFIVILLLLVGGQADCRHCTERVPLSCMNNSNLRISRTNNHYKLKICFDRQCNSGVEEKWINCNEICPACILPSCTGNPDPDECERQVSSSLDRYCASNIPSIPRITVTTTLSAPTTTRYLRMNKTVIVTPNCTSVAVHQYMQISTVTVTISTMSPWSQSSQEVIFGTKDTRAIDKTSSAILGVLFGLSVILLAIVTAGWAWTTWILKNKPSEKAQ